MEPVERVASTLYMAVVCWIALIRQPGPARRLIIQGATMALIDFVKEAGEKLFGRGSAQAAMNEAQAEPGNEAKVQAPMAPLPPRFSITSSRRICRRPDSPSRSTARRRRFPFTASRPIRR